MDKIPVIAIVGPTASGKSQLGVELCKRLNGEVISADSMQIYNIWTLLPQNLLLLRWKMYRTI